MERSQMQKNMHLFYLCLMEKSQEDAEFCAVV